MTELDPKCFKGFPMAITNDGYLLPCCYCDDPVTRSESDFKKLMAVSKIEDYEDLSEIVLTEEWCDFEKNLRKNIGPRACYEACTKESDVRKDMHIDVKNKVKRTDVNSPYK